MIKEKINFKSVLLIIAMVILIILSTSCNNSSDTDTCQNSNVDSTAKDTNTGEHIDTDSDIDTDTDSDTGNSDDITDSNTDTDSDAFSDTSTDINSDSNINTDFNTDTDSDIETDTDVGNNDKPTLNIDLPLKDVMENYRGQTVNILAPVWTGNTASYPWSTVELCVVDYDMNASGYGEVINNAVMERNELIENTYGINLNWINAQSASMANRLENAKRNSETFHLAMPYIYEAMEIVIDKSLYTISDEYINLNAEYYSEEVIDKLTLDGKTFFIGGDFSFLDEQNATVLFYNAQMLKELGSEAPDLYELVLNGTWTIDTMYSLAGSVSGNLDDEDKYTDNDKYGFATSDLTLFYQCFGVYQAQKRVDSLGRENFELDLQSEYINDIINNILYAQKEKKIVRTSWTGGLSAAATAFEDNRVLFYNNVMQKSTSFKEGLEFGILPFPKLNTEQDRYYAPVSQRTTVLCIPKATDDRVLSECMIEILTKSSSEAIMPAYLSTIENKLHDNQKKKTIEIIEKEIFPNLMYDIGYVYGRYAGDGRGVATIIQSESVSAGFNSYKNAYMYNRVDADSIFEDWSSAYHIYSE